MEVNNLASCWLVAALSVGEEEGGKTALQIDTMACALTGEEGTDAGREAKRRRANTTNRGEIVAISGPKWDGEGECKSHLSGFLSLKTSSSTFPCRFFRILGA